MIVSAGSRLGPYEVVGPLGAGGMGEVYRARDTRLGRDVALKVLPEEVASNPARLRRFEKEARSASALNHPNVVTVYDMGTADSRSWIAMELVDGKTLREVLLGGPVPIKKMLALSTQIADGLSRAHEAGIVHRDLKPENVMVTRDGLVKILDFGLAKLTHSGPGEGGGSRLPTETGTSPGVVLGTVAYMSPEQACGHPIDFRSDQFALGAMLYEMATGKRAFEKANTPDTLSAILHEEPPPMAQAAPQAPPPLAWVIERCLAKEPADRYAATKDLARDLANLRQRVSQSSESIAALGVPARSRRRYWLALAGMTLLLATAAIAWLAHRPRAILPVYQRLTFRRGMIHAARFSPGGKTVTYDGSWDGGEPRLFSTRLDRPETTALPLPTASLAAVSSTGRIAITLDPKWTGWVSLVPLGTLAEVPLVGEAPRPLLEGVKWADYASDGRSLAVVRGVDGHDRLEYPVGKVLYETQEPWHQIDYPRFSPNGDGIAFIEFKGARFIQFVDLSGNIRTMAGPLYGAFNLAWNPKTDEIWFTNVPERGGPSLFAVSRSGRQRVVQYTPGYSLLEDISADGSVLASGEEIRWEIPFLRPGATKEANLGWLEFSISRDLSDDGQELLFHNWAVSAGTETGTFLRKTDGSAAVRLGEGDAAALSPDKKWAIAVGDEGTLVALPTGAGESRRFGTGMDVSAVAWFPDGKRFLFSGNSPGRKTALFVQDLSGGAPRAVTPEGVDFGPVSPNGRFIAARGPGGKGFLYPVEGGDPRPLPGIEPSDYIVRWDGGGEALFLAPYELLTGTSGLKSFRIDRYEIASGSRRPWKELAPSDPTGVRVVSDLVLTPDGKSYVYTIARTLSQLYVVDGLR